MEITRESPEWAQRVYEVILETIPEAGFGEGLRVWPVVSWLDGFYVHIVYRKNGMRGLFGMRFDTRIGITGTNWPEAETTGREIVMYGLWEPHEQVPEGYDEDTIYWMGDTREGLPQRLEDVPGNAK